MQIIAPSYITDSNLVSCDISAISDKYPEWDDTVSYITGQRVSVNYEIDGITPGVHKIYECMWHGDGNIDLYPPDNLAVSGGYIWWLRISATNRWRLFDQIVAPDRAVVEANVFTTVWESGVSWEPGTSWSTGNYAAMRLDVLPGQIDSIAIMNADLTNMQVIMTDPVEGEVYNETKVSTIMTEYNGVFSGLPSYPNATVSVSARNNVGDLAIGEIIFGRLRDIGSAKYGIDVGITDYSQKEADDYGNFSVLERSYSKKINCQFFMSTLTHSAILSLLEKYRATPLVWIISNLYSTTIAYGFYRDLQISIINPIRAEGSVNIEGLGADFVSTTTATVDTWISPWDGTIELTVPGIPVIDLTTTLIEEAPVSATPDTLTVPSVPTIAVSFGLYEVADTDGVCTISQASPAIVSIASHGLSDNQEIFFQTSGALPAPLVAGTHYFVSAIDAGSFNVTLTAGGSNIDTTNAGSGTHKVLGKV